MKTNKLAAGALALALGLGAVTPAFAATTATENSGKGEVLVTSDYRKAETTYVNAFKAYKEAIAEFERLTKIRDEKEAAKNEAAAAIQNFYKTVAEKENAIKVNEEEALRTVRQFQSNGGQFDSWNWIDIKQYFVDHDDRWLEDNLNAQEGNLEDIRGHIDRDTELKLDLAMYLDNGETERKLRVARDRALEEYQIAQANYAAYKPVLAAAKAAYEGAKQPFIDAGGDRNTIGLAEKYGDVTYVTEVTPSEAEGEDAEGEDDDTDAKEAIEAAEAALEDAKVTAKGAQLLLDSYPETVKTVRDDLVKLLAEQKGIIEKLEDALEAAKGKSVALSDILFSTAYAAEEESDPIEELKKATEDLEENTQAIKDKLAENEEANKKANENADPEPDADPEPSDDDKEPADKDGEKEPADEMESDENEEKPAEKTETKTEVKTVKKPAKNAKTGVVGVAGVAGVLAAASVAYAASKKNN